MRVLVMGGTLFNGLALVHELVRAGHDVTVVNRGKTQAELPGSVRRLTGDRTDRDRMHELFANEEFDCVQDMTAYHPEDVELMSELFHGKTGHYIFAGSTVVYAASKVLPIGEAHALDRSDRQNEYGLHKILCEDHLVRQYRERGFPATVASFSMVFGPHNALPDREQRMFVRLLHGRQVLIPGDGTTLGQVGHVDDQARALRLMMGKPITFGKRYNITGAQYFTDEGYVDTFGEVVGVEPRKVFVPASVMDAAWDGGLDLSLPASFGSRMEIRTTDEGRKKAQSARVRYQLATLVQKIAPNIHRWNQSTVFGIDRLRADIGWEPEFSFRGMVEHTYDWFRREGLDKSLQIDFDFEDQLLAYLDAARC